MEPAGLRRRCAAQDPGAGDAAAKSGSLSMRLGLGWAKSLTFVTGQCPVMKYHRPLMNAILNDKIQIAKAVNVQVSSHFTSLEPLKLLLTVSIHLSSCDLLVLDF